MKTTARFLPVFILLVVVLAVMLGPAVAQSDNPLYDPVQLLVPEIVSVRDHDSTAFTQGFLFDDGLLYESTGRNGESTLRQVDPASGEVLKSVTVAEDYFAEGLALAGDKLIQLTWKSGVAFVYDQATFEQVGTFSYEGEGWGLCSDGSHLYMSDGTPFLDMRDPDTFELLFSGLVTVQGSVVDAINELECVGDYVYANVWKTDYIIKIDKLNGVVVAVVDVSQLLTDQERAAFVAEGADVLNGIAYLPDTDTFLLTGKYWPKMYEVRFVETDR